MGGTSSSASSMEVTSSEEKSASNKNKLSAPQPDFDDSYEQNSGENAMDLKQSQSAGQNSRRAYLKELRKVVSSADVVLQVLDARDPSGTRSSLIEDLVLSHPNKKLVYVLNKADLVPKDVLSGWLTYLRSLHPTVPFKCNTQHQKSHLGHAGGKANKVEEGALSTNQSVGAEELLGLLKNYCRNSLSSSAEGNNSNSKSIISVGCVGFPNGTEYI